MKSRTLAISTLLLACGGAATVHAATVQAFWSAQSQQDAVANGGVFNGLATASTFPVTPTISVAGTHVANAGAMPGGAPTFTDFQGNIWNGVANATGAGFAFGWNGTSTVGSDALTISLDLTNLQNLSIRMDVRSAQGGTDPRPASFQAVEYSVAGGAFVAVPGANLGSFTTNNYQAMTFDLTSISAIEGQSNVQVRFTVANTVATTSFRMDNIQLTAETIPEPTAFSVLAASVGLVLVRRKRS